MKKKTETLEDQGEKQTKAIEENKKQLYNKQTRNNELLLSKETVMFNNIYNKRLNKINELSKTIDYDDLNSLLVVVAQKLILVN